MINQKGLSTVPAVLLAAFAGLVTAVLLADWVIVEVETQGPEKIDVTIPFPLLVADVAAAMLPDDAVEDMEVPLEMAQHRNVIMESISCLLDAPDATLLRVDDQETHVQITKKGDNLLIEVDTENETVTCTVPIDGIHEALDDWDWKTFDPAVLLAALHQADGGTLIKVETEDARIAINMW